VSVKNCSIWRELCGKEGKLEINFIPARKKKKNTLYLVATLVFYMFDILRVINTESVIKDFSPTDAQLDSRKYNFKFALKFTLESSYMFR
jgi:hypothetical protein